MPGDSAVGGIPNEEKAGQREFHLGRIIYGFRQLMCGLRNVR